MNTRLTIDLKDSKLVTLVRLEAAQRAIAIRDVISEALASYFADRLETASLKTLADQAFTEWNHPQDADYDRL